MNRLGRGRGAGGNDRFRLSVRLGQFQRSAHDPAECRVVHAHRPLEPHSLARIVLGDDHRELIATRLTLNPTITFTAIAAELDCHPSTVSREIDANGGRSRYRPIRGARRQTRDLTRSQPSKPAADPVLKARVETDLCRGLSPEEVAADLRAEGTRACHEPIYGSSEAFVGGQAAHGSGGVRPARSSMIILMNASGSWNPRALALMRPIDALFDSASPLV